MTNRLIFVLACVPLLAGTASAGYPDWRHSGSFYILTTPDGADLPATAAEENFPILVRLDKDWFDFRQARPHGEDIRFATADGRPLAYQVDQWDPARGSAAVWVRVPRIQGNAQQEIKVFWGKDDAASQSSGPAVFNRSNGYLSVWHMDNPVRDEAGGSAMKDQGTEPAAGVVGLARHFSPGKGLGCENVTAYPAGAAPHSTELWFRSEKLSDRVFCWGSGEPRSMVQVIQGKPPHVVIDCYHGPAGVHGKSVMPLGQWVHVFHTYQDGQSRLYVNGRLDGVSIAENSPMAFQNPVQVFLGGWRGYGFCGEIDEARVSGVARSADFVKLQYENQKPLQTVVGPLVQPGSEFGVSPPRIAVDEGARILVTARAGGARKLSWILKADGRETVVAADRFAYTFDAGRVSGDRSLVLQLKAVFADGPKSVDIPVTVKEAIPDPVFTLDAPAAWDGRKTIRIVPRIANLEAMRAKGAGDVKCAWSISGMATISRAAADVLVLTRANNSGTLAVTAALSNGGEPVRQTIRIAVREPAGDPWIERKPDAEEQPVDNQFFARDDNNEGTLHYNGNIDGNVDSVFLKLYADDRLVKTESQKPVHGEYAFAVKLKAGLVRYKVEFGSTGGNREVVHRTVRNLVCGDAYIIDGQSNAVAYNYANDTRRPDLIERVTDWVRTYGSGGEAGDDTTNGGWGNAVLTNVKLNGRGGVHFVGVWPMVIARKLVEDQKVPICLFNGAVGGTRIDQHMPDPADRHGTNDPAHSIYRNLLRRITAARLTHGIRGVLWHQGEADQGYDGPDNCYGCETYQQYFIDLTAAWKEDYPNIRHYYVFQIWPNACSQGGNGASDKLRDVQRRLSRLYSNLSVMPTLAFPSGQGCHFNLADYERMGLSMAPLLERDFFGRRFDGPIAAPDLLRTRYASAARSEIVLEFDQPIRWDNALAGQFYLDGKPNQIASGQTAGNVLTLKLAGPSDAKAITYLDDRKRDHKSVLYGQNGIAALTFCDVPIAPAPERSSFLQPGTLWTKSVR